MTSMYQQHLAVCNQHGFRQASAASLPTCGIFEHLAASEMTTTPTTSDTTSVRGLLSSAWAGDLASIKSSYLEWQNTGLGQYYPWQTIAIAAAEQGQKSILEYSLQQIELDADIEAALDRTRFTLPLLSFLVDHEWPVNRSLTAVLQDHVLNGQPVVSYLIHAGATVTPETMEVAGAANLETQKTLKFYSQNQPGLREVQRAAMKGHLGVIRQLLKEHPELKINDRPTEDCLGPREGINSPPLHRAVLFDQVAAAQLLVSLGANPLLKDELGRTALDLAKGRPDKAIRTRLLEILGLVNDEF